MINLVDWQIIYNNVFRIFPPPDTMVEKIVINQDDEKSIEFNSLTELIGYMAVNTNNDIKNEDIKFYLRNNSLKMELDKKIKKLIKQIKK